MDFCENLLKIRKDNNLSQEDLADLIHVTRQTISKWELGITVPDMDMLITISNIFHISIDELVGQKEDKEENDVKQKIVYHPKTYEYISERKLFGLPLIHIHIGLGLCRAKGIIAIGNIATGFISIGLVSVGVLALGLISLALFAFGTLALGIILGAGAVSTGCLALGGVAIGLFSIGGVAIGLYTIGGCSIAQNIALGGYAQGTIAIGDVCKGTHIFHTENGIQDFTRQELQSTINNCFPSLWSFIVNLYCQMF